MNDEKLKQELQRSFQVLQDGDAPDFDSVWTRAELEYRKSRSRYQRFAGFAAAAVVGAIAFALWPLNGNNATGIYINEEDLLGSTQWIAPSDVLLPKHQFDIYGELPVLIESNDFDEGLPL